MSGFALTTTSTLLCPHGGTVAVVSKSTSSAGGAPLATASDVFTVAGCPYQTPCVTVQWLLPDTRTTVQGGPTLSQSSVGLCLNAAGAPQGAVAVVNTQSRFQTS